MTEISREAREVREMSAKLDEWLAIHAHHVPEMEPILRTCWWAAAAYAAGAAGSGEWVSVEERLPEERGWYTVLFGDHPKAVHPAWYAPEAEEGRNWFPGPGVTGPIRRHVTHWQPLPAPPSEGDPK